MSTNAREPILNVPPLLVGLVGLLVLIHAVLTYWPASESWGRTVYALAFVPARIGGGAFESWTMWLSYAFLHGDWAHLIFNSLWLLIFGTPVLVRIGALRFVGIMALSGVGAAALHAWAHPGDISPMVGASGMISGLTGAAARFAFAGGRLERERVRRLPRLSLIQTLRTPPAMAFTVVWMGANLLLGAGVLDPGTGGRIAWEAHIGGFLVGFLGFALFDRPNLPAYSELDPVPVSVPEDLTER